MTAIWPAGPPKLSIATRSQTRNAFTQRHAVSRHGLAALRDRELSHAGPPSRCVAGQLWVSAWRLRPPGVERVVHHHAVPSIS
jgi:hypothetical protein